MLDIIGWISGFLFAFCGLPQAIKSVRDGNSYGISNLFLLMWTLGEILAIIYVYCKHGLDLPLLFNYCVNLIFLVIIIRYKIFPRK